MPDQTRMGIHMKRSLLLLSGLLIAAFLFQTFAVAEPAKVVMKQADGKYRLYVNGKEFYVKGAGCEFGNIEKLAAHGANSFRTWRTENGQSSGQEVLDRAQKSG